MNEVVDNQKVADFVSHLYKSPNINGEGPLIAEDMLLGFLTKNFEQFKLMFQSPGYFPDINPEKVLKLVISDIYQRSYNGVFPLLKKHVINLDFSFLKSQNPIGFDSDLLKKNLLSLLDNMFKTKDVRYHLVGVLNILENKVIEKYLMEIFKRHGAVYHELVRMQRSTMNLDQYIHYLKILLILRTIVFDRVELDSMFPGQKVNIKNFEKTPSRLGAYATALATRGTELCPGISSDLFEMSIKSNFKEGYTEQQEASARFLFILANRYQNYKPYTTIDRGAESPDKSWFGVVKKNADYYGFDRRMLDGLYIIAGDNNW